MATLTGRDVAVLVRCRDQGRFLAEALDSVLEQTLAVGRIVVVDDGSVDTTPAVVEQYGAADDRVTMIRHERPLGPAAALNAAVSVAPEAFHVALDADDRLSPRFVELTLAALEASGADIAYTGWRCFGAVESWSSAPRFDADELRIENPIVVSSLVRRALLERTEGFSSEFDALGLEDWDFWITASEIGARMVPVEGCWLEYRRHPTSRNSISHLTALRAHLLVYRRHPSVHRRHLARWVARSVRRNAARLVRRRARPAQSSSSASATGAHRSTL